VSGITGGMFGASGLVTTRGDRAHSQIFLQGL